jgi:biotin synthase-like enzyme
MALNEGDGRPEAGREAPTGENGKTLWEKNQCTYCKEEGHWKNECPNKKKKKEKERVTVAAAKSKEACNLEANTAWGDESD